MAKQLLARLRRFFANASLAAVSFLITYLVCEFVFFRFMLPHMSYNIRPHLPDRADFFMQNSKSGYIPRDYIALLGDSYAAGVGDWLLASGAKADKPFHSANVIHDLLSRDVASFGRVNIGSAQAMVQRVTRVVDNHYCYLFPPIEPPAWLVVYFYEGNDFADNYELLLNDIKPEGADVADAIDRFLRERYAVPSAWACHGHFGDMLFRMGRYEIKYWRGLPAVIDLAGTVNKVRIDGATQMAGEFQVPPLQMTGAEIDAAALVFARSLAWLRGRFPSVPVMVVYIPAPSSVYRDAEGDFRVKEVFVPSDPSGPTFRFGFKVRADDIYASSQMACTKIRAATAQFGASFIDARPAIREAAEKGLVHGPRDWDHLNEAGYRALGALVAGRIGRSDAEPCDGRWPH